MGKSKIEWTAGDDGALGMTWNPVRGCSRISEGCRNCYAERQAARFSDPGQYAHGFVERTENGPRWTGKVELVPDKLDEPLSWRKPQRVFVNSMSDLFHESLSDDAIDRVFAVMALAPQHTFQVLTKRPARMREYFSLDLAARAGGWCRHDKVRNRATDLAGIRGKVEQFADGVDLNTWPLPNVWLGVSCEDQATAEERIPLLLDTPAAIHFVSAEPLLEWTSIMRLGMHPIHPSLAGQQVIHGIDWVIVGGESGPGARQCNVAWIRSVVAECKHAGVPCFVKQLGANVIVRNDQCADWIEDCAVALDDVEGMFQGDLVRVHLFDKKGGDPTKWPSDLRVRQFPKPKE